MHPKATEAELIQKATQTAIIAARSILASGGTEDSALKTAKAAAESVLNPAASDADTGGPRRHWEPEDLSPPRMAKGQGTRRLVQAARAARDSRGGALCQWLHHEAGGNAAEPQGRRAHRPARARTVRPCDIPYSIHL